MNAVVATVENSWIRDCRRYLAANRVHKDADSEEGMLAVFICVSTHG